MLSSDDCSCWIHSYDISLAIQSRNLGILYLGIAAAHVHSSLKYCEKDNVTAPHRKIYLDALISDFLPNRNWSFAKTHQWDADGKLWRFPAPKITTRYSTQIASSSKLHWQKALPPAWLSDGTQIEGDAVWRLRCSFEDGPSKHEWHTPILIAPSTSIPDRKSSLLTDLVGTHIAVQLRAAEDQNAENILPRVFSTSVLE